MNYYGEWDSTDCSAKFPFICKMGAKITTEFPTIYPPTPLVTSQPCDKTTPDDGWVSNPADADNTYCYFFNTQTKLSWKDAEQQCGLRGGTLTSIHSNQENGFMISNLKHTDAWIGFNSIYSGDWEWTDRSDVGFLRWAPGGKS